MCDPVTAMYAATAVVGAYGAYSNAKAVNAAGNYNRQVAAYASKDAIMRGEEEAHKVAREARMFKGKQRATTAAHGVALDEGTPAQLFDETDFFASQDIATARTNARNQAWGIRAQGNNNPHASPYMAAGTSLLSGGATAADKWYQRKGSTAGTA